MVGPNSAIDIEATKLYNDRLYNLESALNRLDDNKVVSNNVVRLITKVEEL